MSGISKTGKMPSLRERLGIAYRSFWGGGDWVDSSAPGNLYSSGGTGRAHWTPGTQINWDRITGDLWECPAVQACLNWLFRNFPQAPPIVNVKDSAGEWKIAKEHPLVNLLNRPNQDYDGSILFQGLILSWITNGNAYAEIVRSTGGEVIELYWIPHHLVTVWTDPKSDNLIDYYRYRTPNGDERILTPDKMLHLKFGFNPYDTRLGMSPLFSAKRGIYTLQLAANYGANMMRNFGTIGMFVSPNDPTVTIEPETIADKINAKTTGDMVGSTTVLDFMAKVDYPKSSPQDMALDTIQDIPEKDICALIGIPDKVIGLYCARDSQTYASAVEAREIAWEECVMPMGTGMAAQIGFKLLPEFTTARTLQAKRQELTRVQLAFDYRDVRPLQPDLDKLNTRELMVFRMGLITVGDFCRNTNRPDPPKAIADKFYYDLPQPGPAIMPNDPNGANNPANANLENNNPPQPDPNAGKSYKLFGFPEWMDGLEAEVEQLAGSVQ
jgi:HK97 family phage portal protein